METKRLKNIAILILLLLNAFLLFLLIYQDMQGERAQQNAREEMEALFASEGLSMQRDGVKPENALPSLELVRNTEGESQIAAFLLGESVGALSEGGGIYGYSSEVGTVRFRSSGSFDSVRLMRPVEDAEAFMRQFCNRFGYENITGELVEGNGSLTAVRYADGVPVYGCTITMIFENSNLVGASGAQIDLEDAAEVREESLSCTSALVRFFDFRREAGIVCSEIRSAECVYHLQSTGGLPRLRPIWVVETDTYTYLVDGITGEISRN